MKTRLTKCWIGAILACFFVSLLVLPVEAGAPRVYEWKFQTNKTPGSPFFNDEKWWVDWVNNNSNGRLKITLFPAGQIVKVDDYINALRANTVQMATTWGGYYTGYIPEGGLQAGLPMIFRNRTDVQQLFYDYGLLEPIREAFAEKGVHFYSINSIGPIMLWAKRPIRTLADFKGFKVRASGDPAKIFGTIGAGAVMIPHEESFTALQLGTIEGYATPFGHYRDLKHYEVCKYVMTPAIQGASIDAWSISRTALDELPPDLRAYVLSQAPVLNWITTWRSELVDGDVFASLPKWNAQLVPMADDLQKAITAESMKLLDSYTPKSARLAKMVETIKRFMKDKGYLP
jgi:TRAP-type C4-dicarboxylate transport system substrate-binding protein